MEALEFTSTRIYLRVDSWSDPGVETAWGTVDTEKSRTYQYCV